MFKPVWTVTLLNFNKYAKTHFAEDIAEIGMYKREVNEQWGSQPVMQLCTEVKPGSVGPHSPGASSLYQT